LPGRRIFSSKRCRLLKRSKTRTLEVKPKAAAEHGAVSAEVAEAMAQGIRKRARTDFGLSVTGIADRAAK